MDEIQEIVADNLKFYRTIRGYSQEELGHRCGLHRTYIGGIEQRRTNASMRNLGIIAQALEIDYALLFLPPTNAVRTHMPTLKRKERKPLDSDGEYALYAWNKTDVRVVRIPPKIGKMLEENIIARDDT